MNKHKILFLITTLTISNLAIGSDHRPPAFTGVFRRAMGTAGTPAPITSPVYRRDLERELNSRACKYYGRTLESLSPEELAELKSDITLMIQSSNNLKYSRMLLEESNKAVEEEKINGPSERLEGAKLLLENQNVIHKMMIDKTVREIYFKILIEKAKATRDSK